MSEAAILLAEHEPVSRDVPRAAPARRRVHGPRGRVAGPGARPRRAPRARRRDRGPTRALPPAPGRRAGADVGPQRPGDRADGAGGRPARACPRARERRGRCRAARRLSRAARAAPVAAPAHGSRAGGRRGGGPARRRPPVAAGARRRHRRPARRSRVRARREARLRSAPGLHEDRAPARRLGDPDDRDPHADARLARLAAPAEARGRRRRPTSSSTSGASGTGCSSDPIWHRGGAAAKPTPSGMCPPEGRDQAAGSGFCGSRWRTS